MARGDILVSATVSFLFSKITFSPRDIELHVSILGKGPDLTSRVFRFQDEVVENVRQGYTGRQVSAF